MHKRLKAIDGSTTTLRVQLFWKVIYLFFFSFSMKTKVSNVAGDVRRCEAVVERGTIVALLSHKVYI